MSQRATAVPTQTDDERQFVALVKALDVAGLTKFLDERPNFDCDTVVWPDFDDDPEPNETEKPYSTALHWLFSVSEGFEVWETDTAESAMATLLVQRGASLTRPYSRGGGMLLHIFTYAVPLLIRLGADVHAVNLKLETPLHYAAESGEPNSMRLLIAAGGRVNQPNARGQMPLHRLLLHGLQEAVDGEEVVETFRALLDAGASLIAPDSEGRTPLQLLYRTVTDGVLERRRRLLEGEVTARLGSELLVSACVRTQLQRTPPDLVVQLPSAKCLKLHRWLLSASSPKFRAMVDSGMREATEGLLALQDVPEPSFEKLIECAYGKPLHYDDWDQLVEITKLADEYLFEGQKQLCEQRLCASVTPENAIDSLLLADTLHMQSLRMLARRAIAEKFEEIMVTDRYIAACELPQFLGLMKELMSEVKEQRSKRKRD